MHINLIISSLEKDHFYNKFLHIMFKQKMLLYIFDLWTITSQVILALGSVIEQLLFFFFNQTKQTFIFIYLFSFFSFYCCLITVVCIFSPNPPLSSPLILSMCPLKQFLKTPLPTIPSPLPSGYEQLLLFLNSSIFLGASFFQLQLLLYFILQIILTFISICYTD